MLAEIISIGDELLIGQVVNTNASWISQQLNSIGIQVLQVSVIGDKHCYILDALTRASARVQLVIITGGLGPTKDDITKSTLCEYFESKLVFSETALKDIEVLFALRGLPVTDLNKTQAYIPNNCIPIANKVGTAQGMWFKKKDVVFISLPGVPFEMKEMISNYVLPKLKIFFSLPIIIHKTVLTQGIGESFLSVIIADWENQLPEHIKLAYLPSPGTVRLRLSAIGKNKTLLQKEINKNIIALQQIIPEYIYGYDNETLEQIIGRILKKQNQTLSTAESCTGGYIAHLITTVPGSSAYYKGSIVAYANEIKNNFLDVNAFDIEQYGAVSEEIVRQMAINIRNKFHTNYSIATSGVAGPDGGTTEKPVGTTWIAVASETTVIAKKNLFGENRERNIQKAGLTALNMLRKEIELR